MVDKHPVGSYRYTKVLSLQQQVLCEVLVFLFQVECQLDVWPEKSQRETQWFAPEDAAALVDEAGLGEIIRQVSNVGSMAPLPSDGRHQIRLQSPSE